VTLSNDIAMILVHSAVDDGTTWRFISTSKDVSAAEADCAMSGGHLLTVNSDLDQQHVKLFMSLHTGELQSSNIIVM